MTDKSKENDTGSPIRVGDDRQKQRERHWIHKYTGSPITNVGDKLAGMTEGGGLAGFRPRTPRGRDAGCRPRATRSFCFGKRTQNHWRPGVAPEDGAQLSSSLS